MSSMICQVVHCQICFFFFQAEDGIRDWSVTGVQTCALPISPQSQPVFLRRSRAVIKRSVQASARIGRSQRSEERRVGKEGRARWLRYHEKKKGWNRKRPHKVRKKHVQLSPRTQRKAKNRLGE